MFYVPILLCIFSISLCPILEEDEQHIDEGNKYFSRKESASCLWESCRNASVDCHLNNIIHTDEYCMVCLKENATFRCLDCGLQSVCQECLVALHSRVKLHCPLKWNVSAILYF